jgi:macrolide transport system ATP-binding/permease protein
MNQLIQDVSFAVRQLRKAPGFTLTAILTLVLGIGANAAIFTLVHAVLLRNHPVSDPKSLVRVGDTDDCCVNGGTPGENDYLLFSNDLYEHLRDLAIVTLSASAFAAGLIPARRAATIDPVKALRTE